MNERVVNERVVNERVVNKRVVNERVVNERAVNERVVNERAVNQRAANQRAVNQRAVNKSSTRYPCVQNAVEPPPGESVLLVRAANFSHRWWAVGVSRLLPSQFKCSPPKRLAQPLLSTFLNIWLIIVRQNWMRSEPIRGSFTCAIDVGQRRQ